ncbi:hypothetical protein HK096_010363 [Nowakowskiella sp. JEL0078]|nr:hypothetical protein HK096_010363 [Nowakowskiella sp. JEL0078]
MSTFKRLPLDSFVRPENCECVFDESGNLLPDLKECANCLASIAIYESSLELNGESLNLNPNEEGSDEEVVVIHNEDVQQYSLYDNEGDASESEQSNLESRCPNDALPATTSLESLESIQNRGRTRNKSQAPSLTTSDTSKKSRDNSPNTTHQQIHNKTPRTIFDIGISTETSRNIVAGSRISRSLGLAEIAAEIHSNKSSETNPISPNVSKTSTPSDPDSDDPVIPESPSRKFLVPQKNSVVTKSRATDSTDNATKTLPADGLNSTVVSPIKAKQVKNSVPDPMPLDTPRETAMCNCGKEHEKMIKILDPVSLPASLEACWQLLYGDRPTKRENSENEPFLTTFLTKRKCRDPKSSTWYPPEQEIPVSDIVDTVQIDLQEPPIVNNSSSNQDLTMFSNNHIQFPLAAVKKGIVRRVQYQMSLFNPMGPSSTTCNVKEEVVDYEPGRFLCVRSTSQTPDVPAGNSFLTHVKLCFTSGNTYGSTSLRVSCEIEWTKTNWLRLAVDRGATEGLRAYHIDLVNYIPVYVSEHQELERSVWYLNRPKSLYETLTEIDIPTPPPEPESPANPKTAEPASPHKPATAEPKRKATLPQQPHVPAPSPPIAPISVAARLDLMSQQQQEKLISHQRQQMLVTLALIIAIWALAVALVLHAAAFVYVGVNRAHSSRAVSQDWIDAVARVWSGTGMSVEEVATVGVGEELVKRLVDKIARKIAESI